MPAKRIIAALLGRESLSATGPKEHPNTSDPGLLPAFLVEPFERSNLRPVPERYPAGHAQRTARPHQPRLVGGKQNAAADCRTTLPVARCVERRSCGIALFKPWLMTGPEELAADR